MANKKKALRAVLRCTYSSSSRIQFYEIFSSHFHVFKVFSFQKLKVESRQMVTFCLQLNYKWKTVIKFKKDCTVPFPSSFTSYQ